VFVAVLIRTLREGKTYDDFVRAWYPDKGFGVGGRGPILAESVQNEREMLTLALMDISDRAELEEVLQRVGEQEEVRHERIAEVIESTTLRGLYEVRDEFDFSTDETVEARRPN
jgi:hypothetical protein